MRPLPRLCIDPNIFIFQASIALRSTNNIADSRTERQRPVTSGLSQISFTVTKHSSTLLEKPSMCASAVFSSVLTLLIQRIQEPTDNSLPFISSHKPSSLRSQRPRYRPFRLRPTDDGGSSRSWLSYPRKNERFMQRGHRGH